VGKMLHDFIKTCKTAKEGPPIANTVEKGTGKRITFLKKLINRARGGTI